MTDRDEILRMAREQGLPETEVEGVFRVNSDDLGRMLAAERNRMISDGWRQCAKGQRTTQFCGMVEQARQEEREACLDCIRPNATPMEMAAAIRERGNK